METAGRFAPGYGCFKREGYGCNETEQYAYRKVAGK